MLISNRYRFLYFVVPKSASATLRKSLGGFADIGWPVSNYQQHMTVVQFHHSENAHLFDEYFKFTFVRNPYDRLYSGYLQDRHASEQSSRWQLAKKSIFDEIGDDFPRYFNDHVIQADIHRDWRWICFCPMYEFAYSQSGERIVDFVGKVENFEADLVALSASLGIDIEKASDENVRSTICTAQPKYLGKYDRKTIAAVNRVYRKDFELFSYEMLDPEHFPENTTDSE